MVTTVPARPRKPVVASGGDSAIARRPSNDKRWPVVATLSALLLTFVLLQLAVPLRTSVKIGADEDYELSKATLALKGYKFYTDVWNDQPLLHTAIVTTFLKHIPASVLVTRLVTSAFTLVLLASIFAIALRTTGLLAATIATAMLMASPGFLELSASCMVEIPALAPAVAALAVLTCGAGKWRFALAGVLFAVSFQIKFINVILLPIAAIVAWVTIDRSPSKTKSWFLSLTLFGTACAIAFVAIGVLIGEGSFWLQMKQSWAAHFASTQSFEYGSPADRPFDWSIYVKNWDATIAAIIGVIISARSVRGKALAAIPIAWLILEVIVFGTHKPWWPYYYIHNAIPLCWCAAIGISAIFDRVKLRRNKLSLGLLICCLAAAGVWAGSRLWLQIADIRKAPKIYSSLVLEEIKRFKPFTKFIYTDEPVYSFHSDIPLPPKLGVISLKRFWSGDMTNARLVEELRAAQPGLILLKNETRELPFSDWLNGEYRLVYQDERQRLYAHVTIADKAAY